MQSYAGSAACLAGGFAAAVALSLYFRSHFLFDPAIGEREILLAAAAAAAAGTLAESFPQGPLDNFTVTLAATGAAHLVLRSVY